MNKVDLVVLGFLNQSPMHGYRIAEFFERRGIEFWVKIKMPSVYKALSRLEEKGYLTSKLQLGDNSRACKVYYITESGRQYFCELMDEIFFAEKFVSPMDFWNAFRFLGQPLSHDYFVNLLKHRIAQTHIHEEEMKEKREKKLSQMGKIDLPFYIKMLMEHMKTIHQSDLELMEDMLKEAENPANQDIFDKIEED